MSRTFAVLFVLLSALTTTAATPTWIEVQSPHFALITDAGDKQGRHVLDQMERMRWVFQTLFPKSSVDPASPITVIAVKNKKDFAALEPEAYLAKGQISLAGLFLNTQDKNYILLRLDAENEQHPFATIYHEYTHLQLSKASEWLPLWLNEGLAEFFQNTDIHDKEVQLGEPSFDDLLYLRENRIIPLATLFKVDATSPYYHEEQKGSIFYAESWALTHYIEISDRQNNTHRLSDYAGRLIRHEDPVTAAQESFGDLNQLHSHRLTPSALISWLMTSAAKMPARCSIQFCNRTRTTYSRTRPWVISNSPPATARLRCSGTSRLSSSTHRAISLITTTRPYPFPLAKAMMPRSKPVCAPLSGSTRASRPPMTSLRRSTDCAGRS